MISILLKGRLGNILFQYAAARHLAIKHSTDLLLDFNRYGFSHKRPLVKQLKHFNLVARFDHTIFNGRSCSDQTYTYHEKGHPGFDHQVLLQPDGTCLEGYFQSEKYFKAIESTIRDDLKLQANFRFSEAAVMEDKIHYYCQ